MNRIEKASAIKAVIFDCDGVMFDTAQANRKFYDEVLENFGKPPMDQDQFEKAHMMTVAGAIEMLFPELEDRVPVFKCMKAIGYFKFIPYMKMEDGLIPLLEAIKSRGWIRGIATNRTNTMDTVLSDWHLEPHFDVVVTARDVKNPKPAPDQLLKIMDQYAFGPEQMVFLGDTVYDQMAANAAGVGFIAFRSPALTADAHVDTMDQVKQVLQLN